MKELIEYIAKALVDHPEQVVVKEIAGEKTLIYELRVGPGDLGKVIGKEGRTAKSIRAIIAAAAMKVGKRAQLEILE
ncbi:MAG: KH domain-containing protein [candidate division WOR-3 bacterium]